jgi:hypothetical protein
MVLGRLGDGLVRRLFIRIITYVKEGVCWIVAYALFDPCRSAVWFLL